MAPRSGFLRANCAARCLGRGIGIGAARRRVVAPVDRSRRDDIRPNAVGRQIENLGERRSPSRRVRSRRVTTLGRPWVPRTSASAPDGWPDVGSSGEGREVVLTHPPPRTRQDRPPACHSDWLTEANRPPLGRAHSRQGSGTLGFRVRYQRNPKKPAITSTTTTTPMM